MVLDNIKAYGLTLIFEAVFNEKAMEAINPYLWGLKAVMQIADILANINT